MITFTFYFFAIILVFAASRVITVKNPVHAALFLVLAFFSSAAIWLLLQAEFLAITLVLVYVGAVMVLFLFVVMMLDINFTSLREGFVRYLPLAGLVATLILVEMILVVKTWQGRLEIEPTTTVTSTITIVPKVNDTTVGKTSEPSVPVKADLPNNTKVLGQVLYTDYLYPFEIAAVILLVAMIAAIALTQRPRRQKHQQPEQQVSVRRADRVRLVNMQAEVKD